MPFTAEAIPAVITPLVRRHAEDAAFYWRQIDASLGEMALRAGRAAHFKQILAAHLEGLAVAKTAAVEPVMTALNLWKKPGEAFVAMAVALGTEQLDAQAQVLAHVRRNPGALLRGVISALAWVSSDAAKRFVAEAWLSGDPLLLVAALRGCALRGWSAPHWQAWAQHEDARVRAAACRLGTDAPALASLLQDVDAAVRAEAAMRLASITGAAKDAAAPPQAWLQAAGVLWQCVSHQTAQWEQATGWHRLQALRRLQRWIRHLAWLAPVGHPDVPKLLRHLPRRAALGFVLNHGDVAQLPFVVESMAEPQDARWAGWVWQCLTGVDLREAGLTLPDQAPDVNALLTRAQQDGDQGLPLPNAAAIASRPIVTNPGSASSRTLMGRTLTPAWAAQLLALEANHPQALRAVAAWAWQWLGGQPALNLRAAATQQAASTTQHAP